MHASADTRWIIELDKGATLALALRRGMVAVCRHGSVWLIEYDPASISYLWQANITQRLATRRW